jgi:hypothetical protein
MFLFMVPVGYGWGYRGWGPPYPSYLQRRREQRAVAGGGVTAFNHRSWGLGGDFVWLMLAVAFFWTVSRMWWR